jgi:integrase
MRMTKPKTRTRYINDDEWNLFMDKYATKRIKAHLLFKLETGMDKQDILLVQVSDLRDDGVHTNRHKTEGKERVYEWTPELKDAVDDIRIAYRGKVSSPYLCHTREGKPYFPRDGKKVLDKNGHPFGPPSGWNSQWQRCMKKWKADGYEGFHEHDVRTKVASDTDLKNAQELLDHSDPRITEKVYRVKPKLIKLNSREALENEK